MSSDGSASTTGSRLRQFGLYRTIDERTEEFLRLSRKRQIRQGCACAAISTVVTVTVVISIILVYEYHAMSEKYKAISQMSWLNLMNSSTDEFDPNLNPEKMFIDNSSIKLLPIILRTLKQNGYFDKFEDLPGPKTIYKKNEATESYLRSTFYNTKNWMKLPTSKIYTITYKTSPLIYFKYPTKNIDYYTKNRKIRDYQRIMNYVDKMISEKVPFGSTLSMGKRSEMLSDIQDTTPMVKTKSIKKYENSDFQQREGGIKNCKCQNRTSLLFNKIIKCLQKIIPDLFNNELEEKKSTPPNSNHFYGNELQWFKISTPKSVSIVTRETTPVTTTTSTENQLDFTSYRSYPKHETHKATSTMKIDMHNLGSLLNSLNPEINNINNQINNIQYKTTIPIDYITKTKSKTYVTNESTETVYQKYKNIFMKNITKNTLSTYPIFNEDIEDYVDITKNMVDDTSTLTPTSSEYIDNYILTQPKLHNDYLKGEIENKKFAFTEYAYMSKVKYPRVNIYTVPMTPSSSTTNDKAVTSKHNDVTKMTENSIKKTYRTSTTTKSEIKNTLSTRPYSEFISTLKPNNFEHINTDNYDMALEEESEKTEVTNEDGTYKTIENMFISLNNTLIKRNQSIINTDSPHIKSRTIDTDPIKFSKPVSIQVRPSYLEIQRNNWKPDDNEYDNLNNYFFD